MLPFHEQMTIKNAYKLLMTENLLKVKKYLANNYEKVLEERKQNVPLDHSSISWSYRQAFAYQKFYEALLDLDIEEAEAIDKKKKRNDNDGLYHQMFDFDTDRCSMEYIVFHDDGSSEVFYGQDGICKKMGDRMKHQALDREGAINYCKSIRKCCPLVL